MVRNLKSLFLLDNFFFSLKSIALDRVASEIFQKKVYVAIKKLHNPIETETHAKRSFREIRFLKHFSHDNLIKLLDLFTSNQTPDSLTEL